MIGADDLPATPIAIYRDWLGALPVAGFVVAPPRGLDLGGAARAWLDEIDQNQGSGPAARTTAQEPTARPWLDEINNPQPSSNPATRTAVQDPTPRQWLDEINNPQPSSNPATSTAAQDPTPRQWLDEFVPRPNTVTDGRTGADPTPRQWLDEFVPRPNTGTAGRTGADPTPRQWLDEFSPNPPVVQPAGVISRGGASEVNLNTAQGRVRVWLPDDMSAGDTITGTVVAEPAGRDERQRRASGDTLEGMVLDVNGVRTPVSAGRFTMTVPPGLTQLTVGLFDQRNRRVGTQTLNMPRTPPPPREVIQIPGQGQAGRPVEIPGNFDGDATNTGVSIGGQPGEVIAESPRQTVVWTPPGAANTSLTVTEGGQTVQQPYRNIRIDLSSPRTNLQRGEQTQLSVRVQGLEGLAQPVNVRLQASASVQMSGGNMQIVTIAPNMVGPGGVFETNRQLQAVQSGPFTVTATLMEGPSGPSSPAP